MFIYFQGTAKFDLCLILHLQTYLKMRQRSPEHVRPRLKLSCMNCHYEIMIGEATAAAVTTMMIAMAESML